MFYVRLSVNTQAQVILAPAFW